jgi:hypothetical protein
MSDSATSTSPRHAGADVPNRPPDVQSALSAGPAGTVRWSVQSRPPRGEEGAQYVAMELVAFLNRRGQEWSEPNRPEGLESGIDQLARGPLGELRMQVTRVPTDEAYFRALERRGRAGGEVPVWELADHLMEAIRHKATAGQESINKGVILLLDAQPSLAHGLLPVLDDFDTRHQAEATRAGFHEIWLVTGMHIHRVSPGEWVDSPGKHIA